MNSKGSNVMEFINELPKGFRVLGRWSSSVGLGIVNRNTNLKELHHFSIIELSKTCDGLVTTLIDLGYAQLASGNALRQLKLAILERASTKTVCIPTNKNGLITFDSAGLPYTAYIWDKTIYWFGNSVECKQLHPPAIPPRRHVSLSRWQSSIGRYCKGNPNLIVAICHALSAALRQHHHRSYIVLFLVGPSSTGKTTVQSVVTGLSTNPGQRDAIPQFNGSEPGFRQYLSQYPGQCVCFQDIQLGGEIIKTIKIIFGLADSSSRFLQGGPTDPLSCVTIFSNERSIIEMARCDHRDINDGLYARAFEIHADAPYGMFHDIHEADSPSAFAKQLHQLASQNASTVWPAWIQAIADEWNNIEGWWTDGFPLTRQRLIDQLDLGNQLSAVDRRMVEELAYSAWIGCIANKLGILPFKAEEIRSAFVQVITTQIVRRGIGQTPLAKHAIEAVRGYIDQNKGRFPPLSSYGNENARASIVGYRHVRKDGVELYLFFVESFQRIFVADFGEAIYRYLHASDFLLASHGRGHQFQTRLPSTHERKSFIAIKAKICFDFD